MDFFYETLIPAEECSPILEQWDVYIMKHTSSWNGACQNTPLSKIGPLFLSKMEVFLSVNMYFEENQKVQVIVIFMYLITNS